MKSAVEARLAGRTAPAAKFQPRAIFTKIFSNIGWPCSPQKRTETWRSRLSIEGCDDPKVVCGLAEPIQAQVLARDAVNDLALLKVDFTSDHVAALRAGVRIGEEIAAFGYPLQGQLATGGNYTVGNVSALAGYNNNSGNIQISAPIQPGNSGGPVVDQSGNVIGVVVAFLGKHSKSAAQNVNFAIKVNVLAGFLDSYGVSYSTDVADHPLSGFELAAKAQSFSVLILCEK